MSFHDTVDEIDFDTGIAGDDAESTTNGTGEGEWIDPKEILHSKQWKTQSEALKKKRIQAAASILCRDTASKFWNLDREWYTYILYLYIYNVYIRIYIYI